VHKTDNYDCLLLHLYRVFLFIAAPNTETFPIENMHLSGHPLTVADVRKKEETHCSNKQQV